MSPPGGAALACRSYGVSADGTCRVKAATSIKTKPDGLPGGQPQPQAHSQLLVQPVVTDFTSRNDHQRWRCTDIPLPRQLAAWIIHRRQRQFLLVSHFSSVTLSPNAGLSVSIAAVGGKRCHRRRGIATNSAPGRPDVQQQRLLLAYGVQIQRPAVSVCSDVALTFCGSAGWRK